MDLRKRFGTNDRLEQDGVEVHIEGDTYITLARAGGSNTRYENAMRKHFAPYRRALDAGTLDNKTATEVLQKAYADAVVLGWQGVELDGEPLAFNRDNVFKLFTELPELWKVVQEEATRLANYRLEEVADMGKASGVH